MWVADGETGLIEALKGGYDAIVSDIMLPKMDGVSLVRILRAQGHATPVIMLSAQGDVERRVEGLDAGADDYLPKPFASTLAAVPSASLEDVSAMNHPRIDFTSPPQCRLQRMQLRVNTCIIRILQRGCDALPQAVAEFFAQPAYRLAQ